MASNTRNSGEADGPARRFVGMSRAALRRVWIWGGGVFLVVGLIWGLMPRPVLVETAAAEAGPMTVEVREEGKTRVRHRYRVSPPVAGYLRRIPWRPGAVVEAGRTLLAEIEAEPAGFLNPRALAEAEARVRGAQAAVSQSGSVVGRLRSECEFQEKEQGRARMLLRSGSISVREWETAVSRLEVLRRDLRGAEFGQAVAEFELEQASALMQQVQAPRGEGGEPFRMVSPVDGVVLNVFEENARVVAAGTPLLEVGDLRELEAEVDLLSSDAVGVRPGTEVWVEGWGGAQGFLGRVAVVEPAGFTKVSALGVEEQRVRVRVEFPSSGVGQSVLGDRFRVAARIVVWQSQNVLQVPSGALFRKGESWMVFVVESGRAKAVPVKVGHSNGVRAEVLSGIGAGSWVIVHPPDAVHEGVRVALRSNQAE
jgi:HlyD family secretion protein